MKVSEIMTRSVVTAGPHTPLKSLIEQMARADVSALPVIDASGKLLGIVTEADLLSKEAYGAVRHRRLALLADVLSGREYHWVAKAAGSVASEVMTESVVTCSPDMKVEQAARRMLEAGVKRLPVLGTATGRVVGIVSRHDVLSVFDRPDEVIAADVEAALAGDPCIPEDHHVRFLVDGGVVTLAGDVRYRWDEPVIVSIVRRVPGVLEVTGHLRNRLPNPPVGQRWMPGM